MEEDASCTHSKNTSSKSASLNILLTSKYISIIRKNVNVSKVKVLNMPSVLYYYYIMFLCCSLFSAVKSTFTPSILQYSFEVLVRSMTLHREILHILLHYLDVTAVTS